MSSLNAGYFPKGTMDKPSIPTTLRSNIGGHIQPTPRNAEVQILVDGAYKNNTGAIGGFITINGHFTICWSINIGICPTAAYAEVRAIQEGLLKCHQLHIIAADMNTDS